MHKGYTHFNARSSLHLQRDMLRKLEADLIFLQEVQDLHTKHLHSLGTNSGHMEVLADSVWQDSCYGLSCLQGLFFQVIDYVITFSLIGKLSKVCF